MARRMSPAAKSANRGGPIPGGVQFNRGNLGSTNVGTPGTTGGKFLEVHAFPPPAIIAIAFDKLGLDIRSKRVPLQRSIQKVIAPSIAARFASEGADIGGWAELKDQTRERRVANKEGSILTATGKMARGATALARWEVQPEVAFISDFGPAFYSTYHQTGFYNVHSHTFVASRPFWVITDEDARKVELIFGEWMRERLAAAAAGISASTVKATGGGGILK